MGADNLVNRRVLKKQLGRLGFPIYEAGDGVEALEFLEQTKYWAGNEQSGKDLAIVCCDWEVIQLLFCQLDHFIDNDYRCPE